MRIRPSGLLLSAAGLLLHLVTVQAAPSISITANSDENGSGVFRRTQGLSFTVNVTASPNSGFTLQKIVFQKRGSPRELDSIYQGSAPGRYQMSVSGAILPAVPIASQALGTVSIITNSGQRLEEDLAFDVELSLNLTWTTTETNPRLISAPQTSSTTSSTVFAVASSDDKVEGLRTLVSAANGQTNGIDQEPATTSPDTEPGGGQSPSSSMTTTVTQSPTATGVSSSNSAVAAVAAPSAALSTGAIAGIAIGAGLAALLIAAVIAWLLLRRRRQKNADKSGLGYRGGPGKSGDLEAEKEAKAIVAESPHSPYSDDGHQRDSALVGGAAATSSGAAGLIAAHHLEREHDATRDFSPYSDHPSSSPTNAGSATAAAAAAAAAPNVSTPVARTGSSAMSTSSTRRSSAAFPAPPPAIGEDSQVGTLPPRAGTGMSGRYAHLVEEGMTPEEIARMEEEERQLDVAIERARGVTTK